MPGLESDESRSLDANATAAAAAKAINETIEKIAKTSLDANVVGIIYPPTEVRNIVDKTASFVARNGPDFEIRIRQNELNNPKFNFLSADDPYNAYYQHKVKELREGKQGSATGAAAGTQPMESGQSKATQPSIAINQSVQQKQQEILKQLEKPFVPKDPPPEFEFIAEPPSISGMDLDIVKLTALLVARNGRQFLNQLMSREQKNYQFDFLRPQHSLFQYFTKLLDQYTKVLTPVRQLRERLGAETADTVLNAVKYRAEWFKYQDAQRRKEEEVQERERLAYAQIDWHDFVVVEVVDYSPFEMGNFPAPTTPEEVGARMLMQERIDDGDTVEMQIDSDNEDDDGAGAGAGAATTNYGSGSLAANNSRMQQPSKDNLLMNSFGNMRTAPGSNIRGNQPYPEPLSNENDPASGLESLKIAPVVANPVLPPIPDKVLVKKYDPKQANRAAAKSAAAKEDFLISPLTGEKIAANKFQEHLHHRLLDSRWLEQREKSVQEKIAEENVFAAGVSIEASLKQLAERRTDIFGVGDEETAIGKKIGEEDIRKEDKVTWDGHSSSIEATTRAASSNITIEEQINQIHKVKGLLSTAAPDDLLQKKVAGPLPVPKVMGGMVMMAPPPPPPQQQPPAVVTNPGPVPPPVVVPPPPLGFIGLQLPQQPLPPPQLPPSSTILVKHQLDDEPSQILGSAQQPPAKKLRTEDSLIPEDMFCARNASTVSFKIQVPQFGADKPEWKLHGQLLTFTMALTDAISSVKARIFDEIGMPTAKQKIFYDGMFFKDSNTLAFYNILPGTILHLQLKERGGRKK